MRKGGEEEVEGHKISVPLICRWYLEIGFLAFDTSEETQVRRIKE